ncbi:MAG TPA: MarR family transcriptional regulator, partial [Balneolaceae bacterium]|nr:MarR family transcriptional regulator [Balneolaceae bacterium]
MMDGQNSILDQNLFFLSSALSRKLSSQADAAFAKFGLSTSHVLILLLTNRNPGIQPSSLAERLHLNPSTITRLVQKLERRKLLERKSEGRATSIV